MTTNPTTISSRLARAASVALLVAALFAQMPLATAEKACVTLVGHEQCALPLQAAPRVFSEEFDCEMSGGHWHDGKCAIE